MATSFKRMAMAYLATAIVATAIVAITGLARPPLVVAMAIIGPAGGLAMATLILAGMAMYFDWDTSRRKAAKPWPH